MKSLLQFCFSMALQCIYLIAQPIKNRTVTVCNFAIPDDKTWKYKGDDIYKGTNIFQESIRTRRFY